MCLIIDANVAADLVSNPTLSAHAVVHDWLGTGMGRLAVGGKLLSELETMNAVRKYLSRLYRAGKVVRYSATKIETEEANVEHHCRSNDAHVIALARVSGARRLFSFDNELCEDFKNRELISRPRGKVYRTARHRRLLDSAPPCKR